MIVKNYNYYINILKQTVPLEGVPLDFNLYVYYSFIPLKQY